MTANLTRAEAAGRARLLRVESYQIELGLHDAATSAAAGGVAGDADTFTSLTTVRFECREPGAGAFIDLTAEAVRSMTLNGRELPAAAFDGDRITLADLASANVLTVSAEHAYSRTGEGLHKFTDPVDGGVYLYTNFETWYAHRVYASFDQPDLKATFEFTVRCPAGWQVIANTAPDGPARRAGQGTESWHFPPTPPLPTYVTAIAAGPYHVVRSEHDGIPLGIYCRQSLAGALDPDEIFELTGQGFDYYHRAFGRRYPFGKYDQLFVPEFNSGAEENAGAVTVAEDFIFRSRVTESRREARAETLLHEMAHMWFGDLVTMTWWDDLWLKESFATWASLMAMTENTRWRTAWTTFTQDLKAWAYRQDQLPSTHPIVADLPDVETAEVYFDGITYAKGAAVLRQLVAFAGQENFLAAMRVYFAGHEWGNATLADLLDALGETSGRQLTSWSRAWLETPGVNTLRPAIVMAADGTFADFAVLQEAPRAQPLLRPHRIAIGLYDRADGKLRRRQRIELDVAGERTGVPELAGVIAPDLVLVNDDDLTFAKVRLDERSLRTLTASITEFAEPLPAALCLAAAWDMCRDAELPARDYVTLVLAAAPSVRDIAVLRTILGQAASAVRQFGDPAWREDGLGQMASALAELMTSAAPDSDEQLTYAQVFASVATSPDDLRLLAGLLAGGAEIDGLTIDTDLRWRLLRRLVTRGAAGQEAINAELRRDQTDEGHRQALTAMAAIPDRASKEAAWASIVSGDLPNATFRAVLGGFQAADQDELLAPFAPRYFDVVAGKWEAWGPDMAVYFAQRGYPSTVVTRQAIDDAAAFLSHPGLPPPLRRLISEGRDDVVRALRCRERDRDADSRPAVSPAASANAR
ncbi:MAG TPA: aminopeptidase N [Streptosporangiaceae bacterium]|nr:aminopeptidase N [Streptosporangiaceae bacterium]